MKNNNNNKAVVIFSGGMDSTVCLGYALKTFSEVETITFGYGQKHSVEIEQAKIIAEKLGVKFNFVDITFMQNIVESALTSNGDITGKHSKNKNLPAAFVPNRNAMFITIAHAYAQKIGFDNLVIGACQTDEGGYPDCRQSFMDSIQNTLNMGAESNIIIHAPLMYLTKADTFRMGRDADVLDIVLEDSHTCYNGNRELRFDWGYGCGTCPNCKLRKEGWETFTKK